MNMKKNKIIGFLCKYSIPIILIIISVFIYIFFHIGNQIIFLESTDSSREETISYYSMGDKNTITQDFKMSYPMFSGLNIKIGTAGNDNNSIWSLKIYNKSTNAQLYSWTQNATDFVGKDYYFFKTNQPISVSTKDTYYFTMEYVSGPNPSEILVATTNSINDNFVGTSSIGNNSAIRFSICGGEKNTLNIRVYFIFVCFIILLTVFFIRHSMSFRNNIFIEGLFLGVICFILMSFYINANIGFSDEWDNISAGLMMKNGHILYKDYVCQHPPSVMFLSAIFAIFGAESTSQFRFLYYILMAFGWAYIYIRNKGQFGKFKMYILAIMASSFVFVFNEGYYFLADGISGICMTILFFEFFKYVKSKKIDLTMSITISISIFFSFGSNFMMIYPLFILMLGFLFVEITIIRKQKNINLKFFIVRYLKFFTILSIPFISTFLYFYINNALGSMIDQVYWFNTEVYPYYNNGLGENKVLILFECLNKFITIPSFMISNVLSGQDISTSLNFIGIYAFILFTTYKLFRSNKKFIGVFFISFIIAMLVRSNADLRFFHSIGATYILFSSVIIGLNQINLPAFEMKKIMGTFITLFFFISTVYLSGIINILTAKNDIMHPTEDFIIQQLDSDDTIFVDYFIMDPIYLIYKGTIPINRTPFLLPWYQDWYESWSIEDIDYYEPKIIIYNDDIEVWGVTKFSTALSTKIKNEYTEIVENIWVRTQ